MKCFGVIVTVVDVATRFEHVEVTFVRAFGPDRFSLTLSREEARRFEKGRSYEMTFDIAGWIASNRADKEAK